MSFSEQTEKLTQELINAEYKNACEKFGEKYHSLHEGYAILLEEVEEVKERITQIDEWLESYWVCVKLNVKDLSKQKLEKIHTNTILAISELAQVGAVLQKIKNTFGNDISKD